MENKISLDIGGTLAKVCYFSETPSSESTIPLPTSWTTDLDISYNDGFIVFQMFKTE
jgi:pantothenate kinase